jgi:hypothetical protein
VGAVSSPVKLSKRSRPPQDPLKPYIPQHSKSFDFASFVPLSKPFVIAIVGTFATRAGTVSKATAKRDYYALGVLLGWIQKRSKSFPTFRQKLLKNYKSISVDEWELVLSTWRNELVQGHEEQVGASTRAQLIRAINVFIEAWIAARILKPITRLIPVKYANQMTKPKKCVGEVVRVGDGSFSKDESTNSAEALGKVNHQRLRDLRRCAENEFRIWHDHFREGERLIRSCDMSFGDMRRIIHGKYRNVATRTWALRRLFPKNSQELTLSRYLTYALHENGGLIRYRTKSLLRLFHYNFWNVHGIEPETLQAYLHPHAHLINATQIIFMVDTGANVGVSQSLKRDCLSTSDMPGHKVITGFKDRAKGKPIISELPINDRQHEISCVRAIELYQEMSKRLSDLAPIGIRKNLFLHLSRSRGITPVGTMVSYIQFKEFISRHEEFSGLKLTADMIRPSILFQLVFQSGGDLREANALLDHSKLSTTAGYADRPSLRVIYEKLTREFQSLFEAAAISDIDGATRSLSIRPSEFDRRLKRARRTGLGVACLNPKSGYQPGTVAGKNCEALQNCPRCPLRFVIATVRNTVDLILFREHLRTSQSEFEATRPQRWMNVWLPWLTFADVALERMQRGTTAAIFLKAKAVADARLRSGTVNFPPLY